MIWVPNFAYFSSVRASLLLVMVAFSPYARPIVRYVAPTDLELLMTRNARIRTEP
jgi:hypothetical protein